MLIFDRPDLGWTMLARSMGVEAGCARTMEEFAGLLGAAPVYSSSKAVI